MKILFVCAIFIISYSNAFSHSSHIKSLSKIEMEVLRNNKVIGFSNYYFNHENNKMIVKNETNFAVEMAGIKIFSIIGNSEEVYQNEKLISFQSSTIQNKKKKYVNLKYLREDNKFLIDGSSYKGTSSIDIVIGSWWNHKILTANKQISPLSGSVKDQTITFIKKENISINGKKILSHKFSLKSKDPNLSDDKKLDFEIWLEPKKNIILKVSYNRLGNWEYILKDIILD